jgi:hypothetical protein
MQKQGDKAHARRLAIGFFKASSKEKLEMITKTGRV